MEPILIVGGGSSGLLAGLLAVSKGQKAILVEAAPECGGLLRSFTNDDGVSFDYGTHLWRETGVEEIDSLLFSQVYSHPNWNKLPSLKNGAYFHGHLNESIGFADIRALGPEKAERAVFELLQRSSPHPDSCHSAAEYLEKAFGPLLLKELFAPALKKLYGVDATQLSPRAPLLFNLARVVALTPNETRSLKKSPIVDDRLGYHSSEEGLSGILNFYPKKGGSGVWIDWAVKRFQELGGVIWTGTSVTSVQMQNHRIRRVALSNAKEVEVSSLVWTIPVPFLKKAVGLPVASSVLKFRAVDVYWMTFDRALETTCQYFSCFDPDFRSFRVTIYDNLRKPAPKERTHSVCIEVLLDSKDSPEVPVKNMIDELQRMKVLSASSQLTYSKTVRIPMGFPVQTPEASAESSALYEQVSQLAENLVLTGRASQKAFFLGDTLIHTYSTMSSVLGLSSASNSLRSKHVQA